MPRSLSVEIGIDVPMRDGAMLAADIYRPSAAGPVPAIVVRTPYNRRTPASRSLQVDAIGMAEEGYAVVVQDVRGRFASQREFVPFVHEQADGVDTVLWAADQQWCDGRVGMAGISYLGYCQLAAAAASPEPLLAIMPGLTPCDVRSGWIYEAGVFNLGFNLSWMLGSLLANDGRPEIAEPVRDAFSRPRSTATPGSGVERMIADTPMADVWSSWVSGPELYEGIDAVPHRDQLVALTTPALVVAGWFDVFQPSTLELYDALQPTASLVAGPWAHTGLPLTRREGARDHGLDAAVNLADLQRTFFDRHLRHTGPGDDPCRVFTTGNNAWERFATWPPPGTRRTLFPGSDGHLSDASVSDEIDVRLDASDPTPSLGGRAYGWEPVLVPGPFDQTIREQRPDVITFSSDPFDGACFLAGPIDVSVSVSNAPGGIAVATICDVEPDGCSWNIADGVAPVTSPSTTIRLGHAAHIFGAGHRIRLGLSFGSFPRFQWHPGDGHRTIRFGEGTRLEMWTI